ncbi:MAG: hypothetical protein RLZZ220_1748 [Pseudomonadota bacterium]|jgi:hypothetical protein|uniref:Uncharacterized protein n=1 Tax=Zoogloea ramigera TaxID=350 RepID=A0A4Y4CTF1_ZOORA|nr:hypothetical protein [Zoogloea ramigera]MBP6801151.1 hypothetical protein [Zoogloea sp.]MBP7628006.1 hypothetical protein [Zoogloea sp.]GEC96181.1 hypothetical protein ZRA01_22540 [Zoogloea ramigera]
MESDSVLYGLLGRIHLLMRRAANRIIDIEYMRINKDYAREIVRVGVATGHAELIELCDRLRQAMELDPPAAPAEPRREAPPGLLERLRSARSGATHPTQRYIGSLR